MSGATLHYRDTVTVVSVSSAGYSSNKTVTSHEDVACVFLQNTKTGRGQFQDTLDSDAVLYPDPTSQFISENHNRLEGMYVLAPLYGSSNDDSWYKIVSVTVNRDHLLDNTIDNIECRLKKTRPINGIS